jgi:hypothetical protein
MGAVWHAAYFLAEKAQVLYDGEVCSETCRESGLGVWRYREMPS